MAEKSILKSKTFWFNALLAAGAISEHARHWVQINPGVFTILTAGINLALRMVTEKPVSFTVRKDWTF